jgi:DNA polymerase
VRTLAIDIETYSGTDLTKSGVYKYVQDPDFAILLFAYAFDDEAVQVVDLRVVRNCPLIVKNDYTATPHYLKTAFNANFERSCIGKHTSDMVGNK